MDDVVRTIRAALAGEADPARAVGQQAYMKSALPFHGVAVPRVRQLTRQCAARFDLDVAAIEQASRQLFAEAGYREERYAAIALTGLPLARGRLELVELYAWQSETGAWWDFTDEIAHRIRVLHDTHPVETATIVRVWSQAGSFWLRRLAILSQLRRRDRTDPALLAELIEPNLDDPEFFIRKAIGWALRDYAKTNPTWVRAFADSHQLSPLSRREALKHLGGRPGRLKQAGPAGQPTGEPAKPPPWWPGGGRQLVVSRISELD